MLRTLTAYTNPANAYMLLILSMRLCPLPEPEPEDADEEEELVDVTRDGQARRFGHTAWVPVGAASASDRKEERRTGAGGPRNVPLLFVAGTMDGRGVAKEGTRGK